MSGVRNPNTDEWTPERLAEATRLKAQGQSAAVIAKAIGGTTRCAVVAKLWRMKAVPPKPKKPRRPDAMGQSANPGVKTKALAFDISPAELLRPRRFSWEQAAE